MELRSLRICVVGLILGATVGACAGPSLGSGHDARRDTGASPLSSGGIQADRLSASVAYLGGKIKVAPPMASDVPRLSAAEAISACGDSCTASGTPSSISLGVYSDSMHGIIEPNGTAVHPYKNELAWMITRANVECPMPDGPALPTPDSGGLSSNSDACDDIQFVDANSGAFLAGYVIPADSRSPALSGS